MIAGPECLWFRSATDTHIKTLRRWIAADENPHGLDEDTLNELELYNDAPFSEITKNTYRGLQRIKRNEKLEYIASSLGVSQSWVRSIGIIHLYLYQNPQLDLDSDKDLGDVLEYFSDTQDRIIFLCTLFAMNKNLLVDRKELLLWLENNPALYSDDKDISIVRAELFYWAELELEKKTKENGPNSGKEKLIDSVALDSMINSFAKFQENIKAQKRIITSKERVYYIEQLNRLQVVMNNIREELNAIESCSIS